MPKKRYSFLMQQSKPVFDGRGFQIFDLTDDRGAYVYKNKKTGKFTPIEKNNVRKCKKRILKYLEDEFRAESEFHKCYEACRQPLKRFLVATFCSGKSITR